MGKDQDKKKFLETPISELKSKKLIFFLCVVFFIIIYKSSSVPQSQYSPPKSKKEKACSDNTAGAKVMSERFVKQQLVSPATSDFASILDSEIVPTGNCSYKVKSHVDSQNKFGATLRTHYIADLQYNFEQETWKLIDLKTSE